MQIPKDIFRLYDIRGLYPEEVTPDLAYRLGRAYAQLRKTELNKPEISVAVGEDMRTSSPELKEALVKGLVDEGCDIADIGLVSTPTFYFGVADNALDGGIMVSASHNPAQYNGFKMVREKAIPISGQTGIYDIRDKVIEGDYSETNGTGHVREIKDVLKKEVDYALKHVKVKKLKPFKIVADTANGMGALYLDELFSKLPCKLIKMYWELDGSFPNHEADPLKEETLTDLKKRVIKEKADLGIATDGDGDRIFFVDNKGELIEPSITRGILAKTFLAEEPGSKIGFDVRPGKITEDMIIQNGGVPVKTRVGHSLIKEQMLKENIYFSGESSGHFFLNTDFGCFEMPLVMVVKFLEELTNSNLTASEYVKPLRKYFHSGEINSEVEDVNKTLDKIASKYSDGEISKLDGVTVEYEDYWFNVRGSNTEPKIRLNLEAVSKELMEEKRDEILEVIRS